MANDEPHSIAAMRAVAVHPELAKFARSETERAVAIQSAVDEVCQREAAAKARRYAAVRYHAFRVIGDKTYPLALGKEPESLTDARQTGMVRCAHKDHLVIREMDADGYIKIKLHVYAIKRRARAIWVGRGFDAERVQPLYADPVVVIDGTPMGFEL